MPQLDIDRIIKEASGLATTSKRAQHLHLATKLAKVGFPISHYSIYKWHQEQNIRGASLTALAALALSERRKLDLTKYLIN